MSESEYQPLPSPSDHGTEFLRAALDGDGQLVVSVNGAPLQDDPRLWGCALGDIAVAAARHHVEIEQLDTIAARAAADDPDSDIHEALSSMASQFADEIRIAYPGSAPLMRSQYCTKQRPLIPVENLGKGDRFVLDHHLFILTIPPETYVGDQGKPILSSSAVAVNLTTGDTKRLAGHTPVTAVRFKRE